MIWVPSFLKKWCVSYWDSVKRNVLRRNLKQAERSDNFRLLKDVIATGFNINIPDAQGDTIFHRVMRKKLPSASKWIYALSHSGDQVAQGFNAVNNKDELPLDVYCQKYPLTVNVLPLVSAMSRENLERRDSNSETFALRLSRTGSPLLILDFLPTLVEKKVDFTKCDSKGRDPLYHFLIDEKDPMGPICVLDETGLSCLDELIKAGAKMSHLTQMSVLLRTIDHGCSAHDSNLPVLEKLFETGMIAPTVKDENKNTLLHRYAISYDAQKEASAIIPETSKKMFELLLRYTDVNALNEFGQTPLSALAAHGSMCVEKTGQSDPIPEYQPDARSFQAQLLLDAGTDLTIKDKYGKDVMDYALERGNLFLAEEVWKRCPRMHSEKRAWDLKMLRTNVDIMQENRATAVATARVRQKGRDRQHG